MFVVGGTHMTGAELLNCLNEDASAQKLMHAFVAYLQSADLDSGMYKKRIIMPPQKQVCFLQVT